MNKPNFIVIFCDNLGYGDIGCFGSQVHRTPHLDRMAQKGMKLTSFYVTSGVCTPSRASLLTGCYAQRIDMHISDTGGSVLRPISKKGLNPDEVTIARLLKNHGYVTACVGKWHLGDQPPFLPTRHGFDMYCGIPYSEDMIPARNPEWPPLPLMRGEEVVEAPVDLATIPERYTDEAVKFITEHRDEPFFLYMPHATPGSERIPQVGHRFRGKSQNNEYGDSVEELDWSAGRILDALKDLGIEDRTLVIFTSDNGAVKGHGGSNAPFSGWGYSTMEGGMRMPFIAQWPDRIPRGRTCDALCTSMDLLPTLAQWAGAPIPHDRVIDGKDIGDLLVGKDGATSPHEAFFYYQVDQLQAVRSGTWKLHIALEDARAHGRRGLGDRPMMLCDLSRDPGETTDISKDHPEVVARVLGLAEQARRTLGDEGLQGVERRPAGWVENPTPQVMS